MFYIDGQKNKYSVLLLLLLLLLILLFYIYEISAQCGGLTYLSICLTNKILNRFLLNLVYVT
jgi:hypothetical protein